MKFCSEKKFYIEFVYWAWFEMFIVYPFFVQFYFYFEKCDSVQSLTFSHQSYGFVQKSIYKWNFDRNYVKKELWIVQIKKNLISLLNSNFWWERKKNGIGDGDGDEKKWNLNKQYNKQRSTNEFMSLLLRSVDIEF